MFSVRLVGVAAVFCGDVDCSSVHTQTDDVISPCPPDSFRPEPLVTQDGCCVVPQRSRDQFFLLLSTHADRQGVDISFTVCLFVCLFVCFCECLYGYGFLQRE